MSMSRRLLGFVAVVFLSPCLIALAQPPGAQPKRGAGRPPIPPNVVVERNIQYGKGGDVPLLLDIIRPKEDSKSPRPVIAFIHGGGWKGGTKESAMGNLIPFAAFGNYFCVSIEYRLSGVATWPAQIYDCKAAIRWIKANAKKYNIDPEKIGVWGSSAGGHLVSMLGVSSGVKELEGNGGSPDQSSRVACVVDFCGPSDFMAIAQAKEGAGRVAYGPVSLLLGGPVEEKKDMAKAASPITYCSKDAAPILIMHGTADNVVPLAQAETFYAALKKAGADCTFVKIEGGGHGFGGPEVTNRVKDFFRKYLRSQSVEISSEPIKNSDQPAPKPPAADGPSKSGTPKQGPGWRAGPRTFRKAEWLDPNHDATNGAQYKTFQSKVLDREVSYLIYLPPGYDKAAQRYPVIYWLHGMGGNQQAGAMMFVPAVEAAVKQGAMPPTIVVLVNGMVTSFYCDAVGGKLPMESVIIKDLIPHIDQTYRTVAKREGRAIQGFSMGGYGSAHLGLKYPELFGTVVVDAGALLDPAAQSPTGPMQGVFGDDRERRVAEHPNTLARKNADRLRGQTHIRIGVGSEDSLLSRNESLHDVLTQLKIDHQYEVVPGVGHESGKYYRLLGAKGFDIHRKAFEAIKP